MTRDWYAFLFKLDPTDDQGWAYGLKKAGYATEKDYPQRLLKIINDYQLQQYTLVALGKSADVLQTKNMETNASASIQPKTTETIQRRYPIQIIPEIPAIPELWQTRTMLDS